MLMIVCQFVCLVTFPVMLLMDLYSVMMDLKTKTLAAFAWWARTLQTKYEQFDFDMNGFAQTLDIICQISRENMSLLYLLARDGILFAMNRCLQVIGSVRGRVPIGD